MSAVAELKNRPVSAGLYWMEIDLPRPMDYSTAEQHFAGSPVSSGSSSLPGNGAYGMLHYKDGSGPVDPSSASAILSVGRGDSLEWRDGKVSLQGENGKVSKVVYYIHQDQDIPVPSGLSDVTTTLLGQGGTVIEERDSYGQVHRPNASDQGLGALGAAPLLAIPLYIALAAIGMAIIGWVARLLGFNVLPKALTQPIQAGSDALTQILNAAGKVAKSVGDAVSGAVDTGGDVVKAALWGLGIAGGIKLLRSARSSSKDDDDYD